MVVARKKIEKKLGW